MVGSKTASDLKAVEAHGGSEQFISDKSGSTLSRETVEATAAQAFGKDDIMNKKAALAIDDVKGREGVKAASELVDSMTKQGILKEGSTLDKYEATTDDEARVAWAQSKAGAMESDEKVMLGKYKGNISQNLTSGEGVATMDASNSVAIGNKLKVEKTSASDLNSKESAENKGVKSNLKRMAVF